MDAGMIILIHVKLRIDMIGILILNDVFRNFILLLPSVI